MISRYLKNIISSQTTCDVLFFKYLHKGFYQKKYHQKSEKMYPKLSRILFLSSCRKPRCNCICTCSSSPQWRIWSLEVPWNVPLVVNHAWGENVNRGWWRNPINHQFWMVKSRRKSWDVYHLSTGDLDFAGPSIVFSISPLFHLFWGCGLLTKMVSPLDQGGQSQSSSLEATVGDGSMVNFSTYFWLQLLTINSH